MYLFELSGYQWYAVEIELGSIGSPIYLADASPFTAVHKMITKVWCMFALEITLWKVSNLQYNVHVFVEKKFTS